MTGFEGIGDFDSDDPYQRFIAHQAAKGNYPPRGTAPPSERIVAERDLLVDSDTPTERSGSMTWTVNIAGHDDLEGEAKQAFENGLVSAIKDVVDDIKGGAGVTLTQANVTTNTTGPVDLMDMIGDGEETLEGDESSDDAEPAA